MSQTSDEVKILGVRPANGGKPIIAIRFPNDEQKKQFLDDMQETADRTNGDISLFSGTSDLVSRSEKTIDLKDPNILYIKPSPSSDSVGSSYLGSKSTIIFGNHEVAKAFKDNLRLENVQASEKILGDNVFMFKEGVIEIGGNSITTNLKFLGTDKVPAEPSIVSKTPALDTFSSPIPPTLTPDPKDRVRISSFMHDDKPIIVLDLADQGKRDEVMAKMASIQTPNGIDLSKFESISSEPTKIIIRSSGAGTIGPYLANADEPDLTKRKVAINLGNSEATKIFAQAVGLDETHGFQDKETFYFKTDVLSATDADKTITTYTKNPSSLETPAASIASEKKGSPIDITSSTIVEKSATVSTIPKEPGKEKGVDVSVVSPPFGPGLGIAIDFSNREQADLFAKEMQAASPNDPFIQTDKKVQLYPYTDLTGIGTQDKNGQMSITFSNIEATKVFKKYIDPEGKHGSIENDNEFTFTPSSLEPKVGAHLKVSGPPVSDTPTISTGMKKDRAVASESVVGAFPNKPAEGRIHLTTIAGADDYHLKMLMEFNNPDEAAIFTAKMLSLDTPYGTPVVEQNKKNPSQIIISSSDGNKPGTHVKGDQMTIIFPNDNMSNEYNDLIATGAGNAEKNVYTFKRDSLPPIIGAGLVAGISEPAVSKRMSSISNPTPKPSERVPKTTTLADMIENPRGYDAKKAPPFLDNPSSVATPDTFKRESSISTPTRKPNTLKYMAENPRDFDAKRTRISTSSPEYMGVKQINISNIGDTPENPKVLMEFANAERRKEFIDYMVKEGRREGKDISSMFIAEKGTSELIINTSSGSGLGAYKSRDNKVAINFDSDSLSEKFKIAAGLNKAHGTGVAGSKTFYFEPKALSLEPYKSELVVGHNASEEEQRKAPPRPHNPLAEEGRKYRGDSPRPAQEVAKPKYEQVNITNVGTEIDKPRVQLHFADEQQRQNFIDKMVEQAKIDKVDIKSVLDVDTKDKTKLTINTSKNKGVGAYYSLDKKLAINFGSENLNKLFKNISGVKEGRDGTSQNPSTFYFHPKVLSPDPKKKSTLHVGHNVPVPLSEKERTIVDPRLPTRGERVRPTDPKYTAPTPDVTPPNLPPALRDGSVFYAKKSPAALKSNQTRIYSAQVPDPKKPELAIKFASPLERDAFVVRLKDEAKRNGVKNIDSILNDKNRNNPDVLYIKPSPGIGSMGTFVTEKGELSVSLGNDNLAKFFQKEIGLKTNQAFQTKGSIFIKPEVLSPTPDPSRKSYITGEIPHPPLIRGRGASIYARWG